VRRTNRWVIPGAAAVLVLVAAGCAPAPTPAPPSNPTTTPPALQACPTSIPVGGTSTSAAEADPSSEGTPTADGIVLVAVDDTGRPEIVTETRDDAAATAASLSADPELELVAVESDRPVSIMGAPTALAALAAPTALAGDPHRHHQWALNVLAIEGPWALSTGAGIDVAVIDTGVAGTHPDLAGRLCSGVAFLGGDGVAQEGGGATDPHGHGTHVAGSIAAVRNNGIGIAGVAPSARVLPIRVLDAQGSGSSSDVARGITWAVDHGAEVINLSLGGPHSQAVQTAVDYAESLGVVVVAAAGNAGVGGPPNYPAALEQVVAVASHEPNGAVSTFSTRGAYVDVAAPGSGILSTARDGSWVYMSGTSMATPHVAGVVALLLDDEPGLTPLQVRERLNTTATDAGTPGHDTSYGWGRLNAVGALAG
jgi:serine protease